MADRYVTKHEKGWAVKAPGAKRASSVHGTQKDAEKAARKEANMTQEQLAEKSGTKKSYISKIENGKGNIQLSTLIRIFEQGLNRRIGLTFL